MILSDHRSLKFLMGILPGLAPFAAAADSARARDLGIPFEGRPGAMQLQLEWAGIKTLRRLAKRPSLALGKLGAVSSDGSGDIFVAFSTANKGKVSENNFSTVEMYPNNELTIVFAATVQATEEAIVNAMVAADTMIGASGLRVQALPEDQVQALFR